MIKIISKKKYLEMQDEIKKLSSINESLLFRLGSSFEKDEIIEEKNHSIGPWCHSCENGYFNVDQLGQCTTECLKDVLCKDFIKKR